MGRILRQLLKYGLVALAVCCPLALGFPSNRHRVPNGFRVPCPEGHGAAEGCRDGICHGIGHRTCWGGDFPLNVFGEALKQEDHKWSKKLCEADSDGDGLTNGEELGDPCCLFSGFDIPSDYMANFKPSNPADPQSKVADYIRPSCSVTAPKALAPKLGLFNEGEEVRTADVFVDNYEIPFPGSVSSRTTYVDIAWNFPDDSADLFHVVLAESIVATPKNLHHYVVDGCELKFPADMHGKPVSSAARRAAKCTRAFGGWVPGRQIVEMPSWAGMPIGKSAKIQAFLVNIHYDNPDYEKGIVSRDGMRIHYTPTLRKQTLSDVNAMQISRNPTMMIPPAKRRYFMTRRCALTVKDDVGKEAEGTIMTIGFHGHLLATEMYAERIRDGKSLTLAEDSLWYFDDQYLDMLYLKNHTFKSGDIVETTCVFDSRSRSDLTTIGLETTDEMCWSTFLMAEGGLKTSCEGQVWTGELDDKESGLGIQSRHPADSADGVWDGTNLRSGGNLIANRLDMGGICSDMSGIQKYCPMIMQGVRAAGGTGTDACSKTIGESWPTANKQIAGFNPLMACCTTFCENMCPEHPSCKTPEVTTVTTTSRVTTKSDGTSPKAPVPAEPQKFVTTVIVLKGLDFDKVFTNHTVQEELKTLIRQALLVQLTKDYTADSFVISFTKGSVKAQVDIVPADGSSTAALKASVQGGKQEVQAELLKKVKAMPSITDLLEATMSAEDVTVSVTAPIETSGLTSGVMPTPLPSDGPGAEASASHGMGKRVAGCALGFFTVLLVCTVF